ncbi:MAG: class I SAM-dependent methyltransferase, partial [Deltaproteobacteria bacterium]|nr:class I SAM-dependent methyltransferase [Deltaproteobacteria bacterium]
MPREKIKMPTPEANGFVKTLNNMGFMTSVLDPYSQALVDFAPQAPGPFLEIGAAYGVASLAALEKGCEVIANDMDERHLEILWDRAPKEDQKRLTLKAGAFPDAIDLKPGSVGTILVCRVLHFFTGPMIEKSLDRMFDWLAPGGKVAIIA